MHRRDAPKGARRFRHGTFLLACLVAWAGDARGGESVTLGDLGYRGGQTLRGQGAAREAFFPVPTRVESARLRVRARFSPALDAQSAVTVSMGGEPLATVLRRDGLRQTVTVPVPDRLLDRTYVETGFRGDLAIERDPCSDNQRPSVWAKVDAATAMRFRTRGGVARTIGGIWQQLLRSARIALPRHPSPPEIEAALRVMAALYRRGTTPSLDRMGPGSPRQLPDIVIGDVPWDLRHTDFGGSHPLTVLHRAGRGPRRTAQSAIWLRAPGPATELLTDHVDLLGAQRGIYAVKSRRIPKLDGAADARRRLTFRRLDHPTTTHTFTARDSFRITMPLSAVPSGLVPTALVLNGRGPELGRNGAMMVNVFVNGQYAESDRLESDVILRNERIPVSRGVLGRKNTFRVDVQRLALTQPCKRGMTSTFQLHGGSYVELGKGGYDPAGLRDWVVRHDETLRVVIPDETKTVIQVLPTLARLLADAAQPGTAITVARERTKDASGPFIHVAGDAGPSYRSVPVATDRGRVEIDTGTGRTLRFQPETRYTLMQLVQRRDAWGIWVVPGGDAPMPDRGGFGSGDVALFDGGRTPISLNTSASAVTVVYPEHRGLRSFVRRYRTPLFVAAWVVLTLAVATVVIRMRQRWRSRA